MGTSEPLLRARRELLITDIVCATLVLLRILEEALAYT